MHTRIERWNPTIIWGWISYGMGQNWDTNGRTKFIHFLRVNTFYPYPLWQINIDDIHRCGRKSIIFSLGKWYIYIQMVDFQYISITCCCAIRRLMVPIAPMTFDLDDKNHNLRRAFHARHWTHFWCFFWDRNFLLVAILPFGGPLPHSVGTSYHARTWMISFGIPSVIRFPKTLNGISELL